PRLRRLDLRFHIVDALLGGRAAFGDFLTHVLPGRAGRESEGPQKKRSRRKHGRNPPPFRHLHLLKKLRASRSRAAITPACPDDPGTGFGHGHENNSVFYFSAAGRSKPEKVLLAHLARDLRRERAQVVITGIQMETSGARARQKLKVVGRELLPLLLVQRVERRVFHTY